MNSQIVHLAQVAYSQRQDRGNGDKLTHVKLHLNTKEHLTVEVVKHWSKLDRGVVNSPAVEVLKT